ncbi:MAG: hypothetical protein E2O84_02725 [Bacteroidetes bacterium]|nr:MAG: hypothetical protein E2O84_02725 [Bacteroidota bacterium]
MSEIDKQKEAGRRLAKDLKDLREDRQLDVEELLRATRLPPDILEKFDETALVDHPAFNRVYLRSIISSYAVALKIDVRAVRDALDEAIEGTYQDTLRRMFLDDGETEVSSSSDVENEVPFKSELESEPSVDPEPTANSDPEPKPTLKSKAKSKLKPKRNLKSESDPEPEPAEEIVETPEREREREPEPEPVDGTIHVQETGSSLSNSVDSQRSLKNLLSPRRIIGLGLVIIIVAGYMIWPSDGNETGIESTETSTQTSPVTSQSIDNSVASNQPTSPARIILPDSMEFLVIAAHDHVDPIRISRDRWARRPYWIAHEDTMVVRAATRVIFESDISSARIELYGYTLSDSLTDADGKIDMTRERTQNWLDHVVQATASQGRLK